MAELKLNPHELAVVLIDVQPYFINQMVEPQEPVLIRLEQLLIMTNWFQLPSTVHLRRTGGSQR